MKTIKKTVMFVRKDGIGRSDYRSAPYPFEVETVSQKEIENDRPLVAWEPFRDFASECPVFAAKFDDDDNATDLVYYAREYRQLRDKLQGRFVSTIQPRTVNKVLKTIKPLSLKKAVAAILYWDLFSGWSTRKIDALCERDEEARAFLSFARYPDKIGAMQIWLDNDHKDKFAEALMKFGYFRENAENRVDDRNPELIEVVRAFRILEDEIARSVEIHQKMVRHCTTIEKKAREKADLIIKDAKDRANGIKAEKPFNGSAKGGV